MVRRRKCDGVVLYRACSRVELVRLLLPAICGVGCDGDEAHGVGADGVDWGADSEGEGDRRGDVYSGSLWLWCVCLTWAEFCELLDLLLVLVVVCLLLGLLLIGLVLLSLL